jgi:hypothetical protein
MSTPASVLSAQDKQLAWQSQDEAGSTELAEVGK